MRRRVRKFLKSVGLFKYAKKLVKQLGLSRKKKFPSRYDQIQAWHLEYRGLKLSYDVSDAYSKEWFFPRYDNGRMHEPQATDVFIDHIVNNSQVLDIGGHLGYFSCIAGKLAENGRVLVFEADPKCIGLIRRNLNLNNLQNVDIYNYAVSDAAGTVSIPKNKNPDPGLVINSDTDEHLNIETICIDDFLAQNSFTPDFIKMDIEGSEGLALDGMKKTLADTRATLLIEIHVRKLKNHFDTDHKKIIKQLTEYGYTLREISSRNAYGQGRTIDMNTKLRGNPMILCEK
jgi:FkbM family methyltransferase